MDYTHFTLDQQIQTLKGRIIGWEADHFGHQINLIGLTASNATDAEKESTLKALDTLEKSIIAARLHLATLDTNDDTP